MAAAKKAVEDLQEAQAVSDMVVDSTSVPEYLHGIPFNIAKYMDDAKDFAMRVEAPADSPGLWTEKANERRGSKGSSSGLANHDWKQRLRPADADTVFAAGFESATALQTVPQPTEEQAKGILLRQALRAQREESDGRMCDAMFLEQKLAVVAKEKEASPQTPCTIL